MIGVSGLITHQTWLPTSGLTLDSQDDEECFGFSDLDVSASVERADLLRSESDNLKHDLAEARALQVGCSA